MVDYKQSLEEAAKAFFDLVDGGNEELRQAFEDCVFAGDGSVLYHLDYEDVARITGALNDKDGLPPKKEDRDKAQSAQGADNYNQARDICGSKMFQEKMKKRQAQLSPNVILARGKSLILSELEMEVEHCKGKYDQAVTARDAAQKPMRVEDLDESTYKVVHDVLLRYAPESTLSKIEEAVRATPAGPDGDEWQIAASFPEVSASGRMSPEVIKTIDAQLHPSTGKFTVPHGQIGEKRKWLPVDPSGDSNDARFRPRPRATLDVVAKRIAHAAVKGRE